MIFPARHLILPALLLVACASAELPAWEIQLRSDVATQASTVRLGDVGSIVGLPESDVQALQQVVLTPGPSRSYSRSLSASQIRKLLAGRGVELDECRFTGAMRTVIVYDTNARRNSTGYTPGVNVVTNPRQLVRPTSYRSSGGSAMVRGVEKELAQMVDQQLQELAGDPIPWDVGVTISSRAMRELPPRWRTVSVEGLEIAGEGRHELVACFVSDEGDVRVPLQAVASRMVEMVVPVRALRRGEVVGRNDVEPRYVASKSTRDYVQTVDSVIGQQVQLPLAAGEPLPVSALKRPVLVKRREMVDVVARRAGVVIRTQVRAIDDGTMGDIIAVEKLDGSKDRFVARVSGPQQVEVCVTGASTNRIADR